MNYNPENIPFVSLVITFQVLLCALVFHGIYRSKQVRKKGTLLLTWKPDQVGDKNQFFMSQPAIIHIYFDYQTKGLSTYAPNVSLEISNDQGFSKVIEFAGSLRNKSNSVEYSMMTKGTRIEKIEIEVSGAYNIELISASGVENIKTIDVVLNNKRR